ncbi:unnamed protein product, partial [Symbiodinium necroappetens]
PASFLLLVDAGADKNLADGMHKTALMHAAFEGHADIVRLLLQAGHAEIARLLVDAGADMDLQDARDVDGKSALVHAAFEGHAEIARLLAEAGWVQQAVVFRRSWRTWTTRQILVLSSCLTQARSVFRCKGTAPCIELYEEPSPRCQAGPVGFFLSL